MNKRQHKKQAARWARTFFSDVEVKDNPDEVRKFAVDTARRWALFNRDGVPNFKFERGEK